MFILATLSLLLLGKVDLSTADDQLDLYWDEKAYTRCPMDKPLDGLMGGRYGGFYGADRIALDQGRINGIQKWGLQHPKERNNYPWLDYAVVIQEWTADEQTVSNTMEFGNQDYIIPCDPFDLADDDYIIGYKSWYHDTYVFGLEFYTKSGDKHGCFNKKRIKADDIETGKDFFDCGDGSFYYLVGFKIRSGVILDAIRGQYARLPLECDCYDIDLIQTNNDGQGNNCYTYQYNENYPNDIKCKFDIKKVELGLGNAGRRCGVEDRDLPNIVTSFNGPAGAKILYPAQKVKNAKVTGLQFSGLSNGDQFTVCFDENAVSGTRNGNLEFTPKRGKAEYQCRAKTKSLFNACPNGPIMDEEDDDNKDLEFEAMVMGYDYDKNENNIYNNYWYILLFVLAIIIIGSIMYCNRNKDGKYEGLLQNTPSQYQSV